MVELFVGIDPGASGGIAILRRDGTVMHAGRTPEAHGDILTLLTFGDVAARAAIEDVHSSPQMGVVSAFSFGRGYGALEMALAASEIPFERVRPKQWQTALSCRAFGGKGFGGERRDMTKAKNITKRRAAELFPHAKITHAISDALLIAEYLRRLEVR